MGAPSLLTVSTAATYTITMTSVCGLSASAKYVVTYPALMSADSTTCSTNCALGSGTITITGVSASMKGNNFVLTFSLINPTAAQTVTDSFTVAVSDLSGTTYYDSFTYTTYLPNPTTYTPGSFTLVTVTLSSYKAMGVTTYTFVITVNHKIPSGSGFQITFGTALTVSSTSATVNSVTKSFTYSSQVLTIASAVTSDYANGATITIAIPSVTNPAQTGTISFTVEALLGTYEIDSGTASTTINLPADATATCILTNPTNTVATIYTCSFTVPSTTMKLPVSADTHYMDVYLGSDISGCTASSSFSSTTLSYSGTSGTKDFTLYMLPATLSSLSTLSFSVTCTNPPSTKPTTIEMLLYTGSSASMNKILDGVAEVKTTIGLNLASSSCSQLPLYPGYPTNVTMNIVRSSDSIAAIKHIYLTVPSIVTTTSCAVTNFAATTDYTCTYPTGNSKGNLLIEFTTPTSLTTIQVTLIGSTNPSSPTDTSLGYFKVRTYLYDSAIDYLVDEKDQACILSVTCTSPCRTCETTSSTACLSCTTVGSTTYYYFKDTELCQPESACVTSSGYYKDTADLVCLKCVAACSQCSSAADYCTKCSDSTKVLYKGQCSAACPDQYYADSSGSCTLCSNTCYNCTSSATTCTSCSTGYLYSSTCVTTCPDGWYISGTNCAKCDSSCCTCQTSATTCKSCSCLSSTIYLYEGTCITSATCKTYSGYVPVFSTYTCSQCDTTCKQCTGTTAACTSCQGSLILSGTSCVSSCGAQEYIDTSTSIRQCSPCSSSCNGCVTSSTTCTSCQTGMYFVEDTSSCVSSCGSAYYVSSSSHCIPCNSNCLTCSGSATTCTSCSTGYLYSGSCVDSCPSTTFIQGTSCVACSTNCSTCTGSASYCTACSASYYLDVSTCVSSCSSGKTGISGKCQSCTGQCATCTGATDYCTSCKASIYLYEGTCISSCPDNALPSLDSSGVKICVDCDRGCAVCEWNGTSNVTSLCIKCSTGYLILDYSCYSACPTGYTASTDGVSCVKSSSGGGTTNSTTVSANSTSYNYIPFPHLIAAGAFAFVAIAGQVRDPRSMAVSNTVMLWSYVTLCCYVVQALLALAKTETLIFLITAGVVALAVVLNLLYLTYHCKRTASDIGFVNWAGTHGCTKAWIVSLSTIFSLQTSRLYYSRFIGFSLFYVPFEDFMNVLVPLNVFSFLQILFCYFPIMVLDIIELNNLSWGTQLYITLIESLVLCILMILLLCYEMKNVKATRDELTEDTKYVKVRDESSANINDTAGKPFNEDELRKKVLEDVFSKLGLARSDPAGSDTGRDSSRTSPLSFRPGRRRPKRRHSFGGRPSSDQEEDSREAHSYPCSPRTEKAKEVPLKQYGVDEDAVVPPQDLPDNVYSESKKPNPHPNACPTQDAGAQTPPFKKLQAFKKHLKDQEHRRDRKNRKLFEVDANGERMVSPLEPIAESPDDNDENGQKRPKLNNPSEEEEKKLNDGRAGVSPLADGKERAEEPNSVVLTKEGNLDLSKEKYKDTDAQLYPPGEKSENPINIGDEAARTGFPLAPAADVEPDNALIKDRSCSGAGVAVGAAGVKDDGPVIVDTFEGAGPSMGEGDSSIQERGRRNIHSPPQKVPESADPVLSSPLNPIFPLAQAAGAEDQKSARGDLKKTLATTQKTPDAFEDADGFKFSIANVKESERAKAPEPVAEAKKEDLPAVAVTESKEPAKRSEKVLPLPELAAEEKPNELKDDNTKGETKKEEQPLNLNNQGPSAIKLPQIQTIPEPAAAKAGKEDKPDAGANNAGAGGVPLPESNTNAEEQPRYVDDSEIMGSFERDPNDGYILIKENEQSQLVDLRGRRVNKRGYLVDDQQNIINRKGEIIFRYDEVMKEFEDDTPAPVVQTNKFFEEPAAQSSVAPPPDNNKSTMVEPADNKRETESEGSNSSRNSVNVNPLMGDTPSNYNIQNQRYDDPLDNSRRSRPLVGRPPQLKHPPVKFEPPKDTEVHMARAYGGPPRGAPVRRIRKRKGKSQSANKREAERLFTVNKAVDRVTGFASDIEGNAHAAPSGAVPERHRKRPRLTSEAERPPEEVKQAVKPMTARSSLRPRLPDTRRAKSRRATRRESKNNDELEKVYGENIEDMFLRSDDDNEDEKMSMASIAPSNMSHASNKSLMPQLKGLEAIYLQRLESSMKHNKKQERQMRRVVAQKKRTKAPESAAAGSESERDEISSLISDNYNSMQSQFLKQNAQIGGTKEDGRALENPAVFPGSRKFHQPTPK